MKLVGSSLLLIRTAVSRLISLVPGMRVRLVTTTAIDKVSSLDGRMQVKRISIMFFLKHVQVPGKSAGTLMTISLPVSFLIRPKLHKVKHGPVANAKVQATTIGLIGGAWQDKMALMFGRHGQTFNANGRMFGHKIRFII